MEPIKLHDFFSKVDGSERQKQSNHGALPSGKPVDFDGIVSQEGADHLKQVIAVIHKQESGSGANARTSTDGARGGMQIMPDTFRRYAKQGERIDNPDDNMRVGVRIIKDLGNKFGNDPARIAAGYFSGEGNVNKSDGPAWKTDHADGNGKRVSSYVGDVLSKLGIVSEAHAEQPATRPDLRKAPKWADITANPEFAKLSEEDRGKAKQAYFNHYIKPHAGGNADALLQQFMATDDPTNERTVGEALSDTGVQLAEGVNTIAGAIPNLVAPEGGTAGFFNRNADFWRDKQSDKLKSKIAKADEAIGAADEDGVISQIAEAANQYFKDPALAARFIVTNLPSMIPGIAAAKVAQTAALARGATAVQAGAAATTAAGVTGATLNAGGSRGEAFQDIKNTLIQQGMSPDEAEETALKDSRVTAAVGGAAGFVSGKTGLEKALFTQGTVKGAVKAGVTGAGAELAGEQLEEVAPKLATNFMAGEYDDRSLGKDVGRTIVETGIASAPGGALSGGVAAVNAAAQPGLSDEPMEQPAEQQEPIIGQPVQGAPEPEQQPNPDANEHPTTQAANAIVRDLAREAGLPEELVLPKKKQPVADANTVPDSDVLNFAQSRQQQLTEKRDGHIQTGITDNGVTDQEVSGEGLTDAEQRELSAIEQAGGDVSALRSLYGLDEQERAQEPQAEPPVEQPRKQEPTPDLSERPTEELRQQLRNASDSGVQRTIAQELQQRDADNTAAITDAAHEAATFPQNDLPQPTDAQKEAGNYKKGHINFDGLDITIENPTGSTRSGTDPNGKPWSVDMTAHYGYLKRSEGADGEQVDVYVPENPVQGAPVFVFDQYGLNGKFDEHKAIIGAKTQEEAQQIYDAHFSDGKGDQRRQGVTAMTASDFKEWAQSGDTMKPLSKPKTEKAARVRKEKQKKAIEATPATAKPLFKVIINRVPPEAKEITLNPTTPGDYAKTLANPELQLKYQDDLDALFQERFVAVRKALRGLGWGEHKPGEISKGNAIANFDFKYVGAGRNVVGMFVGLIDKTTDVAMEWNVKDDLTKTPEQIASEVDAAAPAKISGTTAAIIRAKARLLEVRRKLKSGVLDDSVKQALLRKENDIEADIRTLRQRAMTEDDGEQAAPVAPEAPKAVEEKPKTEKQARARRAKQKETKNGTQTTETKQTETPGTKEEQTNSEHISASEIRALRKVDKEFKAASENYGADVTTGPAALFTRGYKDAKSGASINVARLSKPTADMKLSGFNPVDSYLSGYESAREGKPVVLRTLREQPEEPKTSPDSDNAPAKSKDSTKESGEFSGNKIFTADKVAAARERLKSKLGTLNSGIDPEILQDGLTLAGAYIESGTRSFSAYSKAMVADLGEKIRPYLRSFYESARYYPGLDTTGMTTAAEIDLMEKQGTAEHTKPMKSAVHEIEKNSINDNNKQPLEKISTTAQDVISNNEEVDHAEPIQAGSVPAADQGQAENNAAAGDRDSKPVVARLAKNSKKPDSVKRVPAGTEDTGRTGESGPDRTGIGSPVSLGESGANGIESEPAGTEQSTGSVEDHTIDADEIGKGGLAKKYKDNVAAIKVLKAIEAESRSATPAERKTIAKYAGWGAMKGPFDPANKAWTKQHAELKELLTDAEFTAARASTRNAHFTSPVAVESMFSALQRMGVTGGRILEPSVGVGNFFGLMPKDLRAASQLHGVELDSLTSRLVAALYPKAKIAKSTGFENFDIPSEYFDVVIGNPPFGNEPLVDKERSAYSGFSIHNYFLAKSIDKLRPGGVMAVVVSHNFLDAQDGRVRKWIGDRASLIGGVRLPDTAFKENAGTEVVTDILIFQKRPLDGAQNDKAPWQSVVDQVNTNPKTGESVTHKVNQFFVANPGFVLGTPSAGGTMYTANQYTVAPDGDIKEGLDKWVSGLPQNIFSNMDRASDAAVIDMAIPDGIKAGSYYVDASGKVMRRGDDVMGNRTAEAWPPKSESQLGRMKGMIAIRDALRTQMRVERSLDSTAQEIEANRATLNALYDEFVKKYKHINSVTNRGIFLDDTESHLIQGLEFDYDKGIGKATAEREGIEQKEPSAVKADIFERRVAFPQQDYLTVTTAKDALLASLNYRGKVDPGYMAEVYSKPFDEIVKELGDVVFEDPQNGIVTADEYLSGDVKTKLAEAEAAAQNDPKYRRNVEALKAVVPKDKAPSEINVSIGAAFVPTEIYQQFIQHITGTGAAISYIKAVGLWSVSFESGADTALNTGKFGTSELSAQQLFQLTLMGKGAVVKKTYKNPDGSTTTVLLEKETEAAREKQNAIKAEWAKWLWQDPERADKVASIYNDKMNRIVNREFDGSHMSFPGMTPVISLLGHQKNGVWRGLQSYQVLYDHVVGAGKTFEMATLAMEMRRLGIARKPLFVVPNHLTLQWLKEFTKLYPGSNVLAATPEDFSKDNRERLFAKIITGDWDAVIIGHSSLKKIGLPEATETAVLEEQISELSASIEEMKRARGDSRIISDMERIRKNIEAKMKDKLAAVGQRSKMVTFDELGIDAMFVDEMHEFKNLSYHTAMDRNPGMGNPAGSAKAFDMFVKTRWLFDTFGEKTPFITATGTPVSNSLVEMYNMQRYMQYPTLKKDGLHVFDAWAKQFGNVENVYEVAPSGSGYRQSTRFAKFTNLPALMGLYNQFADTITLDDLKEQEISQGKRFPVPAVQGGRPTLVVAKRSPVVSEFMGVPRAHRDDNGNIEFEADLSKEVTIQHDAKSDKWNVSIGDDVHIGMLETEQDAKLEVVKLALTPVVSVDPESILGRFANLRRLTKETKGKVNALSLTGEANKAGLDYRLIDPTAADFEGSKINLAVDNMIRVYHQWSQDKGAQLVFCDLSIPLSARASFSSKPKNLYVRSEDVLSIEKSRGTMHTTPGHEDLPYFIIQRGTKDKKQFDVYDAAAGFKVHSGFASKAAAIEATNAVLNDEKNIEKWLVKREASGEIEQAEIDEYNADNDVDTEDLSLFFTREDIAGMSGSAKFSVYDDIKTKLIGKGIPEREIAFIHDYATPVAKDKLFKAVNAGDIRFLLGSTPKMGAGTNVQQRLVGLHHIDAPWRPSDLEQREGRIIRRGNKLYERDPDGFEIFIGRYATEQTYDTRRWQILEHKARGIEQLRNYDGTVNEIDDIDGEAANAADMKAAASGDPLILKETKLRNDVRRLEQLQSGHADEVLSMTRKARDSKYYAEKLGPDALAETNEMIATTKQFPLNKEGFSPMVIEGGKPKADKESAHEALTQTFNRVRQHLIDTANIKYRGLTFRFEYLAGSVILRTPTGQGGVWFQNDPFSPSGVVQRMKNYIDRLPDVLDDVNHRIEKASKDAISLREQAQQPFQQATDLETAREEHKTVRRSLMAKGPEVPESQKADVRKGIEQQKAKLRELGYGEALDEFFKSNDFVIRESAKLDYEKIEQRTDTTEAQRTEGRNAYSDLLERIAGRAGGNVLGLALANDFRKTGGAALIGQTVKSAGDLASVAQVLRDPRFETFRFFFVKDDKVIHHTGVTSRLPGAVNLFAPKKGQSFDDAMKEYVDAMNEQKSLSGADGYYLLHNHPSGKSAPSHGDRNVTKLIADTVPGFLGHVVINSNEYSVIDGNGLDQTFYKDLSGGYNGGASIPHDALQHAQIKNPEGLAQLGKMLQAKDGFFTVVGLSAQNKVISITEVPLDVLNKPKEHSLGVLRAFARNSGAVSIAVVSDAVNLKRFEPGIRHGVILDATDTEGNTLRENLIGGVQSGGGIFSGAVSGRAPSVANQVPAGYSIRKAQNDLFNFFGNKKQDKSPQNFGTYHTTLSTQYHKALIDPHYGKVFSYANAMQNEVSLASIRPAELAPGVLPRVDDVKLAAKGLFKGRENSKHLKKVADAVFAGTLSDSDVYKGRVWNDTELKNVFGLDGTGIALYRQARAAVDASLDELAASEAYAMAQNVLPKDMRRTIIDAPDQANTLITGELDKQINLLNKAISNARVRGNEEQQAQLESMLEDYQDTRDKVAKIFTTSSKLKDAGYAPLMRFGKWTVTAQVINPNTGAVVRNEDGTPETAYFGKFETEGEAMAKQASLKEKFKDHLDISITSGIDSKDSHELYAGISPETIALFGDAIGAGVVTEKYYKIALSERSSLKRKLERKGTPGYNDDLSRVLSNFITSNARFAAQRYYLRDLNDSIKSIPKEKGDVKDEAIQLKQFIINPSDPAAPLSTVMFAWFLGGSVAAAMVNLSQPFMMTGPYLSQFGLAKATAELSKAMPIAMGMKEITNPDLRAALKRAGREGVVDAQEIFHLYSLGAQSVATGLIGALSRIPVAQRAIKAGGDGARARVNAFLTLWGSMFSLAEKFNRKLTFVAAYNMAPAGTDPYAFAVRAVNETQGIYNKVNRPNWARNPAGRVILTFKQFSLMYVELLSRMWKRGGPEGKRAALIMLAVLMLAAGEEGLPFVQDLDDLIDTVGQLFGLDTNMRRDKRETAYAILGKELGDLFLYGASAEMPLDISGRLGLGNFIPGTALLKKSDEQMRVRNAIELLGPAAGMGAQLGDAYDAATEGNSGKALQNLAPKAIKDLMAAEEMARKGYASDVKGRKVVDVGLGDAAIKASGFNPTKIAQTHRKTMPLQQDISLHRITESSIANQWARGVKDEDEAMVNEAQTRQKKWNEKNPDMQIAINANQIRDRVRALSIDKDTRVLKSSPKEIRGKIGLDLID